MTTMDPAEIIRSPRLEIATRVGEMETPMLRAELARALTVTAETLAYLAAIWGELERRGEDLADLRTGMGQYLPLIASGQLAAEAVVHLAGKTSLLRAVQTLPLAEQRKIALGGTIRVVSMGEDGKLSERMMPATALTSQQIRLVFDHGRTRLPIEQTNIIASTRVAAHRRKRGRSYKVRVDREAGTVTVGVMTVSLGEVLDALRAAGAI